MTPYEIGILLHYYCVHTEFQRWDAPLFKPTADALVDDDLLAWNEGGTPVYRITEKGRFYVEHGLCRVPLPVCKWEIPLAVK